MLKFFCRSIFLSPYGASLLVPRHLEDTGDVTAGKEEQSCPGMVPSNNAYSKNVPRKAQVMTFIQWQNSWDSEVFSKAFWQNSLCKCHKCPLLPNANSKNKKAPSVNASRTTQYTGPLISTVQNYTVDVSWCNRKILCLSVMSQQSAKMKRKLQR